MSRKREIYLDILRIFASYLVIFNHTGFNGYLLFTNYDVSSLKGWIYCIISVLTRINVPLFFMISGVVLLKKNETLKQVLKRAFKYVMIIIVFSTIIYLRDVLKGAEFNPIGFLRSLINNHYNYTYYFLYEYIAYILMLPFLRVLAQNMEKKLFVFLFAICVIESVCHFSSLVFNTPWLHSELIPVVLSGRYLIYPLFGYYIHHHLTKEELKKALFVLVPLMLIFLIGTSYNALIHPEVNNNETQLYHPIFITLNSITIFALFRYFVNTDNFSEKLKKAIVYVSSLTLGIYLLHEPILHLSVSYRFIDVFNDLGVNPMLVSFMLCVIVFVVDGIIIAILKKLPVFKELI